MILSSAERSRRYREKIKQTNPQKFEELKKKNAERTKCKKRKIAEMSEEEKKAKRKQWREAKRTKKDKNEVLPQANPANIKRRKHRSKLLRKNRNLKEKTKCLLDKNPIDDNIQCPSDESDFLTEDPEEDPPSTCGDDLKELHIPKCNVCSGEIRGFRYACVQCSDWDMCGGCEARGEHPHHYVLRVPEPQPQIKVASMIEVLQKQLKTFLDEVENLPNREGEREIKVEYDELELKPDPLDEDVHEESVVPQFTPLTVKQESSEYNKEDPPLTEWPTFTVSQGVWNQENDTAKSKLQIRVENQSNRLRSNKLVMEVVPPGDMEAGKQTQLDESQPGTSAKKRKTREQACASTKIPKIHFKN